MKVFTNGTDTVVAEHINDVPEILFENYGSTMEQEGWTLDEWREISDATPISITITDGPGPDYRETRTAGEWATQEGRGFLCSTEY